MTHNRNGIELVFTFQAGSTTSDAVDIERGCFGTFIVPSGSQLIAKTLQIIAVPSVDGMFSETPLLTTPMSLVEGANPFSSVHIREAGAVAKCRLSISASVSVLSKIVLLWKS